MTMGHDHLWHSFSYVCIMPVKTFVSAVLLFILLIVAPASLYAQKENKELKSMSTEVFRLVNEHRAGMGLKPLKYNQQITDESLHHSQNMASGRIAFGHDGFEKRSNRLMKQIKQYTGSAENVATGASTAREVVEMWLHSAVHKKNIEGNYTLSGIGIARDRTGTLFFTQMFIATSQ